MSMSIYRVNSAYLRSSSSSSRSENSISFGRLGFLKKAPTKSLDDLMVQIEQIKKGNKKRGQNLLGRASEPAELQTKPRFTMVH